MVPSTVCVLSSVSVKTRVSLLVPSIVPVILLIPTPCGPGTPSPSSNRLRIRLKFSRISGLLSGSRSLSSMIAIRLAAPFFFRRFHFKGQAYQTPHISPRPDGAGKSPRPYSRTRQQFPHCGNQIYRHRPSGSALGI